MRVQQEPSSKGSTWALGLLLGIVFASIQEDVAGFFVGATLGVLLAQVLHLRGRVATLSNQLSALKQVPAAPAQDARAERQSEVQQPARESQVASQPAGPSPQVATTSTAASPAAQAPPAPISRRIVIPKPTEPSVFDRLLAQSIAWLKRGNPLARLGIVILFIGGAFLVRYAAEHSLFPIELRFIAVALVASGLLIVGWRLRKSRAVYAQLLQGGGIAGMYLTVFAAASLYQLLPLGFAFALMVVIALSAAVLAVAQNALSLAVIGTAGGFLAPLLVASGSGNHIALFSYYAVLNLGVFAVAWFRTWRVLNVLGFVFTFAITGVWRATGYESQALFSADAFLVLFFLMYVGVSVLNCIRQPSDLKGYVSGSLVFGLPVVAFSLHASMMWRIEYALAWSALALSAFYLLLGLSLLRTRRSTFRLLVEAFAALGVIFGSLAIPLAFDTRTTAAMWAVEGAGLVWLGMRQQRKLARAFGVLLQLAAAVGYLSGVVRIPAEHALLNSAYVGALMIGLSGLYSSYCFHRNRAQQAGYEAGAELALALWGLAWWLGAGVHEIDRFAQGAQAGWILGYVALTSLALEWVGTRLQWRLPQRLAFYLPASCAAVTLLVFAPSSHPFMHWAALGWLLLFAAHYRLLYVNDHQHRGEFGATWLHAGALWTAVLLIAWESQWQILQRTVGVWSILPWGVIPALFIGWVSARRVWPRWPLHENLDAYRLLGAAPLAIAVCVWILVANLTNRGEPVWLPYIPLLNPLDLSVGVCLVALGLWWTALSTTQRSQLWRTEVRWLIAFIAGMVFIWLNAALVRTLHHHWDAPITWYGITHSTLIQSAFSIFWGVLGFIAMTVAARQHWRYAWMSGAALMIIVVIKLFVVDLSSIGTIARIASFLSVGALLLITGYLAPLPPRNSVATAATE